MLVVATLLLLSGAAPPPGACPLPTLGCQTSTGNNGSAVDVTGKIIEPGSRGSGGGGNSGDQGHGGNSHGGGNVDIVFTPQPWTPARFAECIDNWDSYMHCFNAIAKGEDAAPEEAADDSTPAIPAVTITDLASFAPPATALTGEPSNLGVAGLPTNFVATASAVTQQGELFGYPISVRFTPASFTFHYGDGTTATRTHGGSSWADLGQAQFTPTDTSHTYAERGEYVARVDVAYTAEIDLGVGWFPVAGQLTTTGPAQNIRIFEAHTALVAHTCAERPSSPGC